MVPLRLRILWKVHLHGGRHNLFWPIPPPGRTALLMNGFRRTAGMRVFRDLDGSKLELYQPEALAGSVTQLRRLAEAVEDRGESGPALTHSVIAFIMLRQAFLSEEARDTFWRVFEVPVFGQIVGLSGELLAWECEAHEGFHIEQEQAAFETKPGDGGSELLATSLAAVRRRAFRLPTGLTGRIETSICGCGVAGPRLVEVRRVSLPRAAEMLR
jgi:phenylacetate-coenzyme A ligase PaaK-like adenylate-forming protein